MLSATLISRDASLANSCISGSSSKGPKLIEQKVPATYVQLQDVITYISEERKQQGKDPVLHTEEYK